MNNFERFAEKIFDKNYLYNLLSTQERLLPNLISLFSGSQYLTDLLLKEPETFNWLQLPDTLKRSKLMDQLYRESWELISKCTSDVERYSAIRKFRKKEYLRIGLRDLTRMASLKEVLEEISNLADVLLQQCYEFSLADLIEKHGRPYFQDDEGKELPCEFSIIGMGKLGGEELNYFSDIDILYVYSSNKGGTKPERTTQRSMSNHEFFAKLSRKITSAMSKLTADGNVFRVDLGLRPEGSSGDIASSLRSYEVYYESWGRTWERMALLKSRPCAGSKALGNEFVSMCKPFVYRKYLDLRAIDEVKEMKEKINKENLSQKGNGKKNVKLGTGGIREIEFVAQTFRLIFGGKDKRIRTRNLLKSLDKLAKFHYLDKNDQKDLSNAYIFLRNLEHRIQISFGLQTQEFPKDPKELAALAVKMGFNAENSNNLCGEVEKAYAYHTGKVQGIYNKLFYEDLLKGSVEHKTTDEKYVKHEINEQIIHPFPFKNKKTILKNLSLMRDGTLFSHPSGKSVIQFSMMLPKLLRIAAQQPDPDQTINNFEKFIQRCDGRESLYEILGKTGKALKLLLTLFGSSKLLSNTLIGQPYLLDSIFDSEWLHQFKPKETVTAEIEEALSGISAPKSVVKKLTTFKKEEEFRIGLRYLLKEISYEDMVGDLSILAELYLRQVLKISLDSLLSTPTDQSNCGFTIIGMGKLGGSEIDYGSDLDVIFIYGESKTAWEQSLKSSSQDEHFVAVAESIHRLTSQSTQAGSAYVLDTGLRPEGKMGPLAISIRSFSDYLKNRAVTWERQSLIKARFVAGDEEVGEEFLQVARDFVYGNSISSSNIKEIHRLRKRVEDEDSEKNKLRENVKVGSGGIMDIEFITQLLQLKYGYTAGKLRSPSTLGALTQIRLSGCINPDDCDFLIESYIFLRRVMTTMRINREGPSDILPKDPFQRHKLALCLGYGKKIKDSGKEGAGMEKPAGLLLKEYRKRIKRVRNIYNHVFGKQASIE